MRVFDETKTIELPNCDLEKGYLRADTIETEVPEQLAVEEVSHYETIREYPNGGKDVEKIIDVEGKPYIAAHTEVEEIQVYVPYTEEELKKNKEEKYKQTVGMLIRERYSVDDELAIHRQQYKKPEEFAEYDAYVEECKRKAKAIAEGGNE